MNENYFKFKYRVNLNKNAGIKVLKFSKKSDDQG